MANHVVYQTYAETVLDLVINVLQINCNLCRTHKCRAGFICL